MPNQSSSAKLQPDVPDYYYLTNFVTALRWVSARYDDLLNDDELQFIAGFARLPLTSQALLVRLVMRKGPHFRLDKLNYPEIGNVDQAAEPLLAAGWIDGAAQLTVQELIPLLRKDEVIKAFPHVEALRSLKKQDMLPALVEAYSESKSFSRWSANVTVLYTLVIGDLCDRLRLMFFGNLHQTWSEFVLADLGILRYEQVPLSAESRGFFCRSDLEQYQLLWQCRKDLEANVSLSDILSRLDDFHSVNPYLVTRHARLLFKIARQLERDGSHEQALDLYQRSSYDGSCQRRIRILEKLERYDQAYALASLAYDSPESDAEKQLIGRALARLGRKLRLPIQPANRPVAEQRIDLTLCYPQAGSVEQVVRDHLTTAEAPVHYVENTLINSLFGLLCWEAIFAPLPGAFFHPFHSGPVDLLAPDFYRRRAEHFASCFAWLETDDYKHRIRDTYRSKTGVQSPFVFWGALDENLLELALDCLPPAHLRVWFERLLTDIKANRAGMPDLIQFWPQEKRYRMIEVKGPGDRLQDNQRRWLALCAQHAMPVNVCYVQWADT
ncbi:MAG TPA: VRR-NUC domain-containing protein [Pseudomonas xinjiangensis]|uniref:phosphodiesterase I n=2 Tax=root TaxID=1 RepID=A0A7V1BQN1_9GAMM|nr:VRR-NUC domain-containing protein [Halopseudomonas xinjiangensis]HEC48807.1 VRR-NUC domain-containing protein [Halopseudomonas xinjiangensis]